MKWFTGFLALVICLVSMGQIEAGCKSRSKCRVSSKSNVCCSTQLHFSTVSSNCSNSICSNGVCSNGVCSSGKTVIKTSYKGQGVPSDIHAWAIDEANRMADIGTNGHVSPAPPGYFVGVGCNGMTCSRPGNPVAEVHIRGKSVRVWRN
jgi:hypothetical protein